MLMINVCKLGEDCCPASQFPAGSSGSRRPRGSLSRSFSVYYTVLY